jgi:vancomycin resistance protein YoaR
LLGVLLALWGGAYVVAGERVPRGTSVRGVAIGGLSPSRAEAKIEQELGAAFAENISVTVGGAGFLVDPEAAGLGVDVAATVRAASGRTWNPVGLFKSLLGGQEVDPVVTVDNDELENAAHDLALRANTEPVDGTVRFVKANVVSTDASAGRQLDEARAPELIEAAYLSDKQPVTLPAKELLPRVTQAEVDRALREFAEPAVSASVAVQVGGRRITLAPDVLGRALTLAPDPDGRLQPTLDGPRLKKLAKRAFDGVEDKGASATFRIVNQRPRVVPARDGRVVDPVRLSTAVLPALTKTGGARTATVALTIREPAVTTEEARALGVRRLISEYTTFYPSDFPPRLTNIHRAADYMDNTLVLPGETFSLNKEVGERTRARGFAAGYIIRNGKLAVDYGGGVSQLATTTFNAAFFAGLEDVEHHPHSFFISRYPEGREATVAWGAKDLRFRNDSGHGIFITTSYTNSSVTVRIYGTKTYRIEARKSGRYAIRSFDTIHDPRPGGTEPGDCVLQEGVVGFKVDVKRLFYRDGALVRTERFHTTYQPEDRVICGSSGATAVADPAD